MKYKLLHGSHRLPYPLAAAILFLLDLLFHHATRHLTWTQSVPVSVIESSLLSLVLWITSRYCLTQVTLVYLAVPYLFFIGGWLNSATAAVVLGITLYCLAQTLKENSLKAATAVESRKLNHLALIRTKEFFAFLFIVLFVILSGAGGYGHQTPDYSTHNARLRDLIEYSWPIRYGDNLNLVYYIGYFLPSAMVGKLFGLEAGFRSMLIWTVLGLTLVLRWLSQLSQWSFSIMLVLVFMFFGPLDIVNAVIVAAAKGISLADAIHPYSMNELDFVTGYHLNFFIGNYLSNCFQLYWSPQQVIAGWLGMALITNFYREKKFKHIIFSYALLCLWAPLIMIAMLPFIGLIFILSLNNKWPSTLTPENILGAGVLSLIFIVFYLSGSANANPSRWLLIAVDWKQYYPIIFIFFLSGFGIYCLALAPYIIKMTAQNQMWFYCLVFTLLLLPLKTFGEYNDLLCRGSAPLMFLLLVHILQALNHYWHNQQRLYAAALVFLLFLGTKSALMQNGLALFFYGNTQPVTHVFERGKAYPNFGPDNTLFEKYFRKELPVPTQP